jgi:hypothetical protein
VLGNRALSYLKLEDFGYAISDAERALELDPMEYPRHLPYQAYLIGPMHYKAP